MEPRVSDNSSSNISDKKLPKDVVVTTERPDASNIHVAVMTEKQAISAIEILNCARCSVCQELSTQSFIYQVNLLVSCQF